MRVGRFIVILGVLWSGAIATAQQTSDCVELLRHGIYNTYRSSNQQDSVNKLYNETCSNYNSIKSSSMNADVNARYQLFSGGASLSRQDVEVIGQAMCTRQLSDAEGIQKLASFSSVVSGEGLAAFSACVKNQESGVKVTYDYSETIPENVTISAYYSRPKGGGPQRVTGLLIQDASGVPSTMRTTCSGVLAEAARANATLDSNVLTMTCTRPSKNDERDAFKVQNKKALAYPAKVTVSTTAGPIIFPFEAIYLPTPPSPIPPAFLGEIRTVAFPSTDSDAFKSLRENGWLECDGRSLRVSDYPELYSVLRNNWGTTDLGETFKIPDLRGQFLRGWNHDLGQDAFAKNRLLADPDIKNLAARRGVSGDAVGSRQPSSTKKFNLTDVFIQTYLISERQDDQHGRAITGPNGAAASDPKLSRIAGPSNGDPESPADDKADLSNDTYPKNVSVMYVIYTGKRSANP